jgi:hypothetical protein
MMLYTENLAKFINTVCKQNAGPLKVKWVIRVACTGSSWFVLCYIIKCTYHCGVAVTTPAPYSGDALFACQSIFGVSVISAPSYRLRTLK